MKYAFVFPGQGSQFVGMGKELAENFKTAKEVFQEVNDALSQDLFKLMVEGPENELTLTANAQPALMANSMAIVRVLEKDFGVKLKDKAAFVAGHSLGEYSAACAAGVFSLVNRSGDIGILASDNSDQNRMRFYRHAILSYLCIGRIL